jgi:hypothetical protein
MGCARSTTETTAIEGEFSRWWNSVYGSDEFDLCDVLTTLTVRLGVFKSHVSEFFVVDYEEGGRYHVELDPFLTFLGWSTEKLHAHLKTVDLENSSVNNGKWVVTLSSK